MDFAHEFKPKLGGLGADLGERPAEEFSSFNVRDAGHSVVSQIANVHIRPRFTRVELQLADSRAAAHRTNHIVVAWRPHEGFAFFVEGSAELLDSMHRTGRIAMVKGAMRRWLAEPLPVEHWRTGAAVRNGFRAAGMIFGFSHRVINEAPQTEFLL